MDYLTHGAEYPSLARHARKDGSSDMVVDKEIPQDVGDDVPTLPFDAPLGSGSLGEDEDAVTLPGSPGERRPGGGLPSPPGADAPRVKAPGRLARMFGAKPKADEYGRPVAPSTKEVRPKPARTGKRVSGAETLTDIWSGVGSLAVRNPAHVPLGRYLQFQAPVAGEMLDEAVAGTVVDKVALQPIVRARGRFDLIGAVFGPPALILAMERNPARAELLMPMLRSSIRNALPLMVPAIKRVAVKEAKAAEAAADLLESDENFARWTADAQAHGVKNPDPADYILSMIFDGWAPPQTENVVDVETVA